MKKIYVCFILLLVGIVSCKNKNNNSENAAIANTLSIDTSAPIGGVFEAVLPCADCQGIDTRIFLQKDYTFIKEENYQGAKDTLPHIFYDLGKWTVKDSIILLATQTSDTTKYKILPDQTIQMLAQDGTSIPDSVKGNFHFAFKGKSFETAKPFLVSGVLDKADKNNTLFVCVWGKALNVSFTEQAKMQLDSFWNKLKNPSSNKAILQGEALFDAHSDNKLSIQKVHTVIEGDNCN